MDSWNGVRWYAVCIGLGAMSVALAFFGPEWARWVLVPLGVFSFVFSLVLGITGIARYHVNYREAHEQALRLKHLAEIQECLKEGS